jgi:hypothetical protein
MQVREPVGMPDSPDVQIAEPAELTARLTTGMADPALGEWVSAVLTSPGAAAVFDDGRGFVDRVTSADHAAATLLDSFQTVAQGIGAQAGPAHAAEVQAALIRDGRSISRAIATDSRQGRLIEAAFLELLHAVKRNDDSGQLGGRGAGYGRPPRTPRRPGADWTL